jgi:hypothetical protein
MEKIIINKDYFKSINSNVIDEILNDIPYKKELIFSNSKWAEYLKFYLILTYGKEKIPFIPDDILYTSRYYWIKLFYHYYALEFGLDAGVEQQISELIVEMCDHLEDYNWDILENISNEIANKK